MRSKTKKYFEDLAQTEFMDEEGSPSSFWQDARRRFLRNKMAVFSSFILFGIVLFAIFGGFFSQWSNEEVDWSVLGQIRELGAPSIADGHYFGVDELGRDLYARMVQASRVSLMVAFISAIGAIVLGAVLGAISGYYGKVTDRVLLGFYEVMTAIPYIIFFVVWQAFFGRSMFQLLFVMIIVNWTGAFLIVRGQVMLYKNKEFVDAARLMGLSDVKIIARHILPNMLGIIVITGSLMIPSIIMSESLVSFLGVGIQEPDTSWGKLLSEGAKTMQYGTLWQLAFPALFFVLAQVSLYYIGDGLRDALDPKVNR